jgi:hypothetical protein
MLYQQNNISRMIIIKHLTEGICQVDFTKIDGTNRKLYCTLVSGIIPSKYKESIEKTLTQTNDSDIVPVWDITEGKWKSFRISKINFFRSPDELKKQDKSGQDVESKTKETIEKEKSEALQESEKRSQSIKEQREEIKLKNKKIAEDFAKREIKRKEEELRKEENRKIAKSIIDKLRTEAEERRNLNNG